MIQNVPATALRHASCRHCRHEILFAPRVGWIETYPGLSYDACPESELARHEPDPATLPTPYWQPQNS